MSEGGGKRKSKGWYRKQAYHNKRMKTDERAGHRLIPGLKGFIITCNDRERDAVKESYNILNEYADKLYGPETKAEAEHSGESDGDDIEAAIAKEVQDLKEATAKGERRFQNSHSGAKNCIFIKTTLEDPAGLVHAIFTDLHQTKVQKSRHALRLLPVVGTCKANVKEINELAKVVLQPFFTEAKLEVTFTIAFKARNNNGVGREMVVSTLRETIMEAFPSVLLRFTHANPQITILVEVMCGVACIAVAKDFALFRKYNLVEVVLDKPAEPTESGENCKSENAAVTQSADTKNADSDSAGKTVSQQVNEESCVEKSGDSQDSKSTLVAEKETDKVPEEETDKVPEEETDKVPEEETDKVPEKKTDKVPEKETDKVPEKETDKETDKVPSNTDLSSGQVSECTVPSSNESQGTGETASADQVCEHTDRLTVSAESGVASGEKPANTPAASEPETGEAVCLPPATSH